MKRKRHTTEQIIRKLREAEQMRGAGKSVGEVCQALSISDQTYHRWKAKYRGMGGDEIKRLRAVEDENRRLKRLVAEQALDIQILKEAAEGNF